MCISKIQDQVCGLSGNAVSNMVRRKRNRIPASAMPTTFLIEKLRSISLHLLRLMRILENVWLIAFAAVWSEQRWWVR